MSRRNLAFLLFSFCTLMLMAQVKQNHFVEILYFHGKQRCITCRAIEKYTHEVINSDYSQLIKSGQLRFKEVDISTEAGEKLADKYHITWSSLYVNSWRGDKEQRNDLTRFAFKNARSNTPAFKEGLKKKINQLLK